MRKLIGAGCIAFILALCAACAPAAMPAEPGTPPPESMDLRGQGLQDVAYLQEYTWLKRLDLRDNEIGLADYDALAAALPDCEIRWSVPIAGTRADSEVTYLRVERFSEADIDALAYFGRLQSVDARGCTDYAPLMAAAERYEALRLTWAVSLGGQRLTNDVVSLDLSGEALTAEEISGALALLPRLETVKLYDLPLTDAEKRALLEAYPDVRFGWTVELLPGLVADSADSALDLRKYRVTDVDALIDKLLLLPRLTSLDMCECGPPDEDMLRIREALPNAKVIWMVDVAGYRIRTDIRGFSTGVRMRFPNGGGYRTGPGDYHRIYDGDFDKLLYCTDLVALDIGHCMKVTDVSFIAELPKLRYLIISMLKVSDISALAVQTELEFLEIYDNYIVDITPLRNCTKLKYLNCSNNPFTDVDTLIGLKTLERLWITASDLTDEQLLELRAGLPDTTIMDSRNRGDGESLWRTGNWAYVDMQRIFGLRAQFQGSITPSPVPLP